MHKGIWLGMGLALGMAGMAPAAEPMQDDLLLSPPAPASAAGNVRGILRARDQAMLSSELAGRILEMPFAEGQSFRKGDLLVRFDCSAYQAQLSAAQAGAKAASEQLAHNRQLAALNSVGRFEVALAEAKLSEAQAQAQVYQVQVRRCSLVAPYDGQVVQRKAQPYESVSGGAPLLEIVDNRSLEVRLLVPSRWVAKLKVGQSFTFIPDETGEPLQAQVKLLGARIDEGSQMLPLIASLPAETKGLLAGMSGSARFAEMP